MSRYQIKITLNSDLCVSDGGVYNSLIDTDVCYDKYGFPYIPGKRLKGCLRECAQELNDWGKDIPIEKIFGDTGNQAGSLRIGNALLNKYAAYKKEVAELLPNNIACRQNVVNHFTYIRTQTSLNPETGVAKTGSLRTFRVVKKGLEFVASVQMDAQMEEAEKKAFADCCSVLKHMGIGRTRGLGEVNVELIEDTSSGLGGKNSFEIKNYPETSRLGYQLKIEDPVVCKSVNGGEENTQDYIEGSKVLGILLQRARGEDNKHLLNSKSLVFSNAYIAREGKRCTEVPASYFSIKNNSSEYVDQTGKQGSGQKDGEQLNQMKHCYVCKNDADELVKESVNMEQRYHHRRPEDKGIGRAVENADGNSHFYQISSISPYQSFSGYIQGSPKDLEVVARLLSEDDECYVGYGKKSEYGKCMIMPSDLSWMPEETTQKGDRMIVKLDAPAIVYGDKATYSTDADALLEEVIYAIVENPDDRKRILEDMQDTKANDEKEEKKGKVKKYINYTTVGGFNITWGLRKPHIEAFDKGTVLDITFGEEVDIPYNKTFFIGERNKEGYGEMRVFLPEAEKRRKLFCEGKAEDKKTASVENSEIGQAICGELFEHYIRMKAAEQAKSDVDDNKWKCNADVKPTVANLLLMCSENDSIEGTENAAADRFGKDSGSKPAKKEISDTIFKSCKKVCGSILKEFNKNYDVKDYKGTEAAETSDKGRDYTLRYLKAYLTQIKYSLRDGRGGKES